MPILIEIQSLQDIVALVVISKSTKEVNRYVLRFSSFVTPIMNQGRAEKAGRHLSWLSTPRPSHLWPSDLLHRG